MGNSGFVIISDTLGVELAGADLRVQAEMEEIALNVAQEALIYAKENAPWQDRTGDARQGLDVEVDSTLTALTIQLFHTVDYGLWLEVIQSGRFAIIMPTLEKYEPILMARLKAAGGVG